MKKRKLLILSKRGSIYYTDTDCIVTDIKLDDTVIGNEIGKFKLEHVIKQEYFLSNKTYAFRKSKGKVVIKTKGTYSRSVNFEQFNNIYLGVDAKKLFVIKLKEIFI